MQSSLKKIFGQFQTDADFLSAEPYGTGHIHQTYLVNSPASDRKFILQKLNRFVFRDTDILMENLERITFHLSKKIPSSGTGWDILEFFPAYDGRLYYTDETGEDWRVMNYISNDLTGDHQNDVHRAAGEAYGKFITLLGDLPGPSLKESIPDFHNLKKRLKDFHLSVESGLPERKKAAAEDILLAEDKAEEMLYIPNILSEGKIKLRPTHNDTKLDNILFSASGKVRCVVDLDTVMPGLPHFDFGDAIRSFGNSCKEDEPALDGIFLRMDVFSAFSEGFIRNLPAGLNEDELGSLVYAPAMFAYMQGIRFLGDYLTGDHYYITTYPEHNLIRARNQFRLLRSMTENFNRMKDMIEKIL